MNVDEEDIKRIWKIFGCNSTDEESDGESEELDRIYELNKPRPVHIDPNIHTIVDIGCKEEPLHNFESYSAALKKNLDGVCDSNGKSRMEKPSTGLSKAQKKRLRKKKKVTLETDFSKLKISEKQPHCDKPTIGRKVVKVSKGSSKVEDNDGKEDSPRSRQKLTLNINEILTIQEKPKKSKKKKKAKGSNMKLKSRNEKELLGVNGSDSGFTCSNKNDHHQFSLFTTIRDSSHHEVCNDFNVLAEVSSEATPNIQSISVNKNISFYTEQNVNNKQSLSLQLLSNLEKLIINHMKDGYFVSEKTQQFISSLYKLEIKITRHTRDLCFIITQIAICCENFMKSTKKNPFPPEAFRTFFEGFFSTVLQIEHRNSKVPCFDEMGVIENYLLNTVLSNFLKKVIVRITTASTGKYQNFIENNLFTDNVLKVCLNWQVLVNVVRRSLTKTSLPQTKSHSISHDDQHLYTEACSNSQNSLAIDHRVDTSGQPHKILSTSNEIIRSSLPSQSKLQSFVIEDLTENKKYYYNTKFVGKNAKHWENFQSLYEQSVIPTKSTSNKSRSKKKKSRQALLQPLVIDDLTREKRAYLYYNLINVDQCAFHINYPHGDPSISVAKESSQTILHPLIIDDLARERNYFYCYGVDNSLLDLEYNAFSINSNNCDQSNKPSPPILSPLIIDDLTRERNYFYPHSENSSDFLAFHTGETKILKEKSCKQFLSPSIIDDLTHERPYLYPYCDNFESLEWNAFHTDCFNVSAIASGNRGIDFFSTHNGFSVEFLLVVVILLLTYKTVFLYPVWLIVSQLDVILSVFLLLYMCVIFIINF